MRTWPLGGGQRSMRLFGQAQQQAGRDQAPPRPSRPS